MQPTTVFDRASGTVRIPLFRRDGSNSWATVDLSDYHLVQPYRWWEARRSNTTYAGASLSRASGRGRYTNYGCRCGVCKAAESAYQLERRRKAKGKAS